MNSMKYRFCTKKNASTHIISGKFRIFVRANHNSCTQMRTRLVLLFFLSMLFLAPFFGQSQPGSNIVSRTLLSSGGAATVEQRVYDNGLGDVIQEVQSWSAPSLPDIIVHHEYDEYRRLTKSWLPVTSSSASGYISSGTIADMATSQYSDTAPYARTVYDNFLPSQPASRYKAGAQWQNNGKKVSSSYSEAVETGMFSPEDGYLYTFSNVKYLRTQTVDEDGGWTAEYTDLNGRLLISETNQGQTYYLYNPKGDITYVIPPVLSAYLVSNYGDESQEIPDTDAMMQKYAYVYRYDQQRHCIYKKLPGCDPVYYIYDKTGTCILTQDGKLRQNGKWAYSIPDKFGRPCLSGICQYSGSYTAEPLHSVHVYAEYDGTSTPTGGYTVYGLALNQQTLYSAMYYDSYSFIGQHGVPSSLTASTISGFSVDASLGHGLQTGSATAVINGNAVTGYTYSALYYDSRYNVSQVKATNHLGGTDVTSTSYSYTGKPLSVNIQYTKGNTGTFVENSTYTYDDADRMASCTMSVSQGVQPLSTTMTYGYDALGRLTSISRPFTSGTVNYTYDLHGWTKGITTNSFREELFYADGPGNPRYSGNVSSIRWRNDDYYNKRGYRFTYDTANRLTQAVYGEGDALTSNSGRFSENVQYDANGNITGVTRYGKISSSSYGLMDNLTLTYDGNQLTGVTEAAADYDFTGSFEYKRLKGSQYMYDSNGSLIADKSRGIAYIAYDLNNNPSRIYFTNGNETRYVYSATGQKLRVTHYVAMPNITREFGVEPQGNSQVMFAGQKDYLLGGSLVMQEEKIDKVLFDGGYFKATVLNYTNPTTYGFTLYYYNKDHLGNNREVVNASGNVQQVTNYYPFGAPYADPVAVMNASYQPYKYNGKELDTMHGLNTYDYGARQYDPILARWDRMDPLCEKYYSFSPYAYCENDPINSIDPDGRIGLKLLLKGAYKVGKTVAKNGLSSLAKSTTYATAFKDVVDDAKTVFDSDASTLDRTVAGLSLLSEVVSPVSLKETEKAVEKAGNVLNKAVLGKTKISTEVKHVKGQIGSKTGRGKNRLQPNPEATGDHSTFKTDKDGKITNTATYIVNPQNPSGFQEVKRVDRFGASHNGIPTPHVHENGKVRPAKKEDL